MKKIWMYGITEEIAKKYLAICDKLGVSLNFLHEEDFGKTFDEVLSLECKEVAPFENCPLMLMEGVSSQDLVDLLTLMQEAGCPFEGIKVMHTECNGNRVLNELMQEVLKEHLFMSKYYAVQNLTEQFEALDTSVLPEELKEELHAVVLIAKRVLANEACTEDDLDLAMHELKDVFQKIVAFLEDEEEA